MQTQFPDFLEDIQPQGFFNYKSNQVGVIQQDFASCFKSVLLLTLDILKLWKNFLLFIHVWNLVGRFLREGKNEQRKNKFFPWTRSNERYTNDLLALKSD